MLEVVISDTLIKFHASGFFLWLLIFALTGSLILNGLKIHTWILDRKLKKMKKEEAIRGLSQTAHNSGYKCN